MRDFGEELSQRKRTETRKQRSQNKNGSFLNCSLVSVEFQNPNNVGFLIRAAACFGVKDVHVIGHIPCWRSLKEKSGTTNHLVHIYQYKNPQEFINYLKTTDSRLVCMEQAEEAVELKGINKYGHFFLALGNETTGIPVEFLLHADQICYISMPGPGICLNTAQVGNIALYELTRGY